MPPHDFRPTHARLRRSEGWSQALAGGAGPGKAGVQECTLTDVTEFAFPAAGAEAAEGVHFINARAPIAARLAHTVVNVCGRGEVSCPRRRPARPTPPTPRATHSHGSRCL